MDIFEFISSITFNTLWLGAATTVLVYLLKWTKFVNSGDVARVTAAVISALLSGLSQDQVVAMFPVVLTISTGLYELIDLLYNKYLVWKESKQEK